ncbi:ubiquitin-2 like Rad60 SUMO-like-domain-containing protein [Scheffersomyces amazonensis]|uniref:ubiquitin-2 like Rad60 SUMO-like-domain-containing protein n=1 Tax=Scheffersomyces amazonensis TaxID=1078765 RepID=UPI00315D4E1A
MTLSQDHDAGKIVAKDKKRLFDLEDDFFSLSTSGDKKKKKKSKHKGHHHHSSDGPDTSSDAIKVTDNLAYESSIISDGIIADTIKTSENNNDINDNQPPPQSQIQPQTKTQVSSSILKVKVDREAIRTRIEKNYKKQTKVDSFIIDDTEDQDLEFLREDRSFSPALATSNSSSITDDAKYKFTSENERKRKYIIKVMTKLAVPKDFNIDDTIDFGTHGMKSFEKIKKAIIKYFRAKLDSQLSRTQLKEYDADNVSLIWVEAKMEMKPFFKPSTLRIDPHYDILSGDIRSTIINCLLIPKVNVTNLSIYFKENSVEDNSYINGLRDEIDDELEEIEHNKYSAFSDDDDDEVGLIEDQQDAPKELIEDTDEFFTIGLKGKDNKRISIKVSPQTQLQKLLLHYLKVKSIDETKVDLSRAKLIFDDEEMDLNGVVGDTELEEDFEVQVVI